VRRIRAVAGRELRSYFLSPVGYIIIGLFVFLAGLIFIARVFHQGQPASMRPVFEWGTWLLLIICPAITMRAISEERRLGTFEMLMTCPVSDAEVIIGKFLGAFGFLVLMLLPTAAHIAVLESFGRPDYGEMLCGYLGMVLAGTAYVATGLLASTLTTSQVVAFLLTLFFWLGLAIGTKLLPQHLPEPWAAAAFSLDPDPRLRDFAIGLIDSSNVVYFLSFAIVFVIAAVGSLGARRWA
jgi:ABC-2 type transport system permease protein